jgi:hypothetical protein
MSVWVDKTLKTSMVRLKILKKFSEYQKGEVIVMESGARSKFLKILGLVEDIEEYSVS